jgi:hypothetical protein
VLKLVHDVFYNNNKFPSWPGLTRPPRVASSALAGMPLVVQFSDAFGTLLPVALGGRVKPGHDELLH